MLPENEQANYETFRDCLSSPIIQRSASKPLKPAKRKLKGRKNAVNPIDHASPNEVEQNNNTDAEDLADFIDVNPPPHPTQFPTLLPLSTYLPTYLPTD